MRVSQNPSEEITCLPDSQHLSDEALVFCLRGATEQQTSDRLFEEIYNRYHDRVVNWSYAVAKNRESALDLAQEVFFKVSRNLHAFRGDSRVSTWIYVITRNHCINALRKRDVDPSSCAAEIPMNLEGENGLAAHRALEKAESFQHIYRVISSILTPLEVKVLWLHYANDHTLDSITRQLLLSNRSGAKAFIVSGKRKLKLYLYNRGITSSTNLAAKQPPTQQYRAFAA
jgi:RNA polymerase sigma-70 factor, ECF subfamily